MKYEMATSLFIEFLNYKFHKDLSSSYKLYAYRQSDCHGCSTQMWPHLYCICSGHYHLHISAAHNGKDKAPVDPLVGGGSLHQRKALNHTTTKFLWVPLDWIPFLW